MRARLPLRPPAETFQTLVLAYAVATVLAVRLFLQLTGYPKLGGGGLHIAHLLWGGLLMLVAGNLGLLAYGKGARRASAIALGIGFGLFIDEVGKFVTQDNDYFYRPAAALIYTAFVALFVAVQALRHLAPVDDRDLLLRAVEELEEVVRGDFDEREKAAALEALDRVVAARSPYAPLARELRALVRRQAPRPPPQPRWVVRWLTALRARAVSRPAYRRWLVRLVGAAALFGVLKTALQVVAVLAVVFGAPLRARASLPYLVYVSPSHVTAAALQTVWAVVASAFAVRGVWLLRRDLSAGLHDLHRAFLLLVVVVDAFGFYIAQFGATVDVLYDLAFLEVIHALLTGSPVDRGQPAPPWPGDAAGPIETTVPAAQGSG